MVERDGGAGRGLMKQFLLLLAVTIAVSKDGVTLSSMTLPGSSFWGIQLNTLVCTDTASVAGVDCGSTTVRAVAVSTGPVVMKSPIDGSCAQIDFVNPNSTCHATQWVPCPL